MMRSAANTVVAERGGDERHGRQKQGLHYSLLITCPKGMAQLPATMSPKSSHISAADVAGRLSCGPATVIAHAYVNTSRRALP